MVWRIDDPQGNEAAKVKYEIVPYTRGAVLDMGCGPKKAFPHFIGVDSCKDTELFGIEIKPNVKCDVADPKAVEDTFQSLSVDAIFSSHCLEHIENHEAALAAWWDIIKVGGHLVLYLPHRDLYPNIGTDGANPDHVHDFVPDDIIAAMRRMNWHLKVNEVRDQDREYSFLMVFEKLEQHPDPDTFIHLYPPPKEALPKKTVCVCRYGGFGDMIQTSAILPALKRAGFHVTVMTTPKGREIIEHDPHVDDWIIQDTDQVPNEELSLYWRAWQRKFDRFVNLSESVEGHLLALPGRSNHQWPVNLRRKYMGTINYGEWTAELAGVPFEREAKFFATIDEAAQAKRYLRHVSERVAKAAKPKPRNAAQQIMGHAPTFVREAVPIVRPVFNIMWCLSGSSIHKAYPHMDSVIARILLEMPEAAIHFTGDVACQILEAGWEEEPRVFRQSGEMSIRQTLALAQACDLVIGPETGVLNAVAFEENWKIVMLSHSSFDNLTKHWARTITIEPSAEAAPCFPCHRLHYDRTYCPFDNDDSNGRIATHAALCAFSITPATVFEAVKGAYEHWKHGASEFQRPALQLVEA